MIVDSAEKPAVARLRDRLRRLHPEQARAARALFAGRPQLRLGESEADACRLSFRPLLRPPPRVLVELAGGDEAVLVDAAIARPGSGETPSWYDYDDDQSRLVAWTLAEEALLRRLADAFGTELDPRRLHDGIEPVATGRSPMLWLLAQLDDAGGEARRFALAATPAMLMRALEHPHVERRSAAGDWRALGATLAILLDGPPLTAAQLRGLDIHDVIVAGRQPAVASALRLVYGDTLAWPAAQLDGTRARVSGAARPWPISSKETPAMHTSPSAAPPDAGAESGADAGHPADRLPLAVDFQIGQLQLTLADVGRIEPGYVFELPHRLDGGEVRIRVNGQVVGRGELVAVGDVLGVRLTSWDAHGHRLD